MLISHLQVQQPAAARARRRGYCRAAADRRSPAAPLPALGSVLAARRIAQGEAQSTLLDREPGGAEQVADGARVALQELQRLGPTGDGRRSAVVSSNEQTSPDVKPEIWAKVARVNELAACAALAD